MKNVRSTAEPLPSATYGTATESMAKVTCIGVQRDADGARPGAAGDLSVRMEVCGRQPGEQKNQGNAPQRDPAPQRRCSELAVVDHAMGACS